MPTRTEYGAPRSTCDCHACVINCQNMPGFLIPADLARMIPEGADPFTWAEANLLASPGALAMRAGQLFRIHTLVSATKPDGSCIHLDSTGHCGIHENAPFGCAFFDCGEEVPGLAHAGMTEIMRAGPESLYWRIWEHLQARGKRQHPPEELRARMRAHFDPLAPKASKSIP